MKYQLVIFDFDGTLANSFPWFVGVFNTIADKYKFKRVAAGELDTLRGYSARQMIQHLGVPAWKLPLIGRHAKRLMGQNAAQIALFAGVDGMLHELARHGVTLAVVSSNSEANIRRVLGPENAALITYYQCGAALFGKHVQFRKILKQSRIPRSRTLCIGDEIRDIEAARRVDLPFGAVAWGFTDIVALKAYAPEEVFSRVEEIVEKIA